MGKSKAYKNPIVHEEHTGVGFVDFAGGDKREPKSKYHLQAKRGKRKQFNKNGGSRAWLRTRHRVRKKMLR